MRRFPVFSRFLVALGFLAVQAMAVVHATSHELKPEGSAACEVCALAHAAGAAPAALDTSNLLVPQRIEPAPAFVAAVPARLLARPHSRGPPHILA
ncbi:MAG: hypothetical protein JOY51_03310 [Nevskia sp.]|nr:hypothetical protein [Nevskia sp.]